MFLKSISCRLLLIAGFILSASIFMLPKTATAQIFYESIFRPSGLKWQQISSPHFKVVFPLGYEKQARRTIEILESELPKTNKLTGSELTKIPVVLNTYNDRSNGYVTPIHFRIEVELPPILGKSLNQGNGDWLSVVMPHELVHASHGAVFKKWSVYSALRLVSPDLYRATNFAVPSGHIEGIAVHHESDSVVVGTGRGNYADFTNQFEAVQHSATPWSMGQLYFPSQRTLPFNRHYLGGHAFSKWLIDEYGSDIIGNIHDKNIRFPFLGMGAILKLETDKWPKQLHKAFTESQTTTKVIKHLQSDSRDVVINKQAGVFERRPQWLNESELLYFGRYYNDITGLYRVNVSTNEAQLISETGMTTDYRYSLNSDKTHALLGAEIIHPIYDVTAISTLLKVDLTDGKRSRLNAPKRTYAPEFISQESLYSIQRKEDRSALLKLNPLDGAVINSWDFEDLHWIAISAHPTQKNTLAVVAQYYGQQALWIVENESDLATLPTLKPLVFVSKKSVFDPVWSSDGMELLFSSDRSGVRQVYSYSLEKKTFRQLTQSAFGAMEAQYSPDLTSIAYVELINNTYQIQLKTTTDIQQKSTDISAEVFQNDAFKSGYLYEPTFDASNLTPTNYRGGFNFIRPRSIFPADADDGFGVSIGSNDLLRRINYQSDITFFKDRVWHDTDITLKGFYPGLSLGINKFPIQQNIEINDSNGELFDTINIYERNRVELFVPGRVTLAGNQRLSYLLFQPGYRYDNLIFYDNDFFADDEYSKHGFFLRSALGIGLLQASRDIIPRAGWVFDSEFQLDTGIRSVGSLSGVFDKRNAASFGATKYLSLNQRRNWVASLSAHQMIQSNGLVFDAENIIHPALEAVDIQQYFGRIPSHLISIRSKLILPLLFPDNGWVTVPTYVSSVYLSLNHNSIIGTGSVATDSFHLVGGGLRAQFQFAQLQFDLGIGVFYDTNTGSVRSYFGSF
jgi:hypothetical protein